MSFPTLFPTEQETQEHLNEPSFNESFSFDMEFSFDDNETNSNSNKTSSKELNFLPQSEEREGDFSISYAKRDHSNSIINDSSDKYYQHFFNGVNQKTKTAISRVKTMETKDKKKSKKVDEEKQLYEIKQCLLQQKCITFQMYQKFKGNFAQLISNQQTSRLFQYYFPQTKLEVIQLIFEEIQNDISSLLFNPYANYFCLKLLDYINKKSQLTFIKSVCESIDKLSINKISTFSVQCLIEHLTTFQEKVMVLNAIYPHLKTLCLDVYGTHVIEKILSVFEYNLVKPIHQFVFENFIALVTSSNGLCVVKMVIQKEYQQENFHILKNILANQALFLVQNAYGNYAIQTALEFWDIYSCEEIMTRLYGKITCLSIQKYSSNVIETCLKKSFNFFERFFVEITSNDFCNLICLLNNSFGNYVLQTAIQVGFQNGKMDLLQCLFFGISNKLWVIQNAKLMMKWNNILNSFCNVEANSTNNNEMANFYMVQTNNCYM